MRWGRSKKSNTKSTRRPYTDTKEHPVFSYYGSKAARSKTGDEPQLREPAYLKSEKPAGFRLNWKHLPAYLAAIVIFICLAYALTLQSNSQVIVSPLSNGATYRPEAEYQKAAEEILESSVWNKSKLTVHSPSVEQQLKKRFPELADVTVAIPLVSHRPVIGITLKEPAVVLSTPSGAYVIDSTGKVLIKADQSHSSAWQKALPITEALDVNVKPGANILSSQDIAFTDVVLQELAAKKMHVKSLNMPTVASEIHLRTDEYPYLIKLNTQGDPKLQMGTLFAVQEELAKQGKAPGEYIDVRLGERAFVR